MNLKFWQKKTPDEMEQDEADDDRTVAIAREAEPAEENGEGTARPGLLARMRNALSALRMPSDTGNETGTPDSEDAGEDDREVTEEPVISPVRNLKKRLIIGGALGAMTLLLAGIGLTTWKLLAPSEAVQHKPPETTAQNSAAMQAQIEALKKQNEQMHSQLDALKKTGQAEAQAAPVTTKTDPATSGHEGVLVFTGKDTKASAEALRQAIEAMNAESGGGRPKK